MGLECLFSGVTGVATGVGLDIAAGTEVDATEELGSVQGFFDGAAGLGVVITGSLATEL